MWERVGGSSDPEALKSFLEKYPRGQFRDAARARLGELLGEDYAELFTRQLDVHRGWSGVEKMLERRADLIPVLVETLRAAGIEEPEALGRIAAARAQLLNAINSPPGGGGGPRTPEQRRAVMDADESFGEAVGRLRSLPKVYPQLRRNESYVKVSDELAGVENRIRVAAEDYNHAAQVYNAARTQTKEPGAAERLGFPEEPTFKGAEGRPSAPEIRAVPPA